MPPDSPCACWWKALSLSVPRSFCITVARESEALERVTRRPTAWARSSTKWGTKCQSCPQGSVRITHCSTGWPDCPNSGHASHWRIIRSRELIESRARGTCLPVWLFTRGASVADAMRQRFCTLIVRLTFDWTDEKRDMLLCTLVSNFFLTIYISMYMYQRECKPCGMICGKGVKLQDQHWMKFVFYVTKVIIFWSLAWQAVQQAQSMDTSRVPESRLSSSVFFVFTIKHWGSLSIWMFGRMRMQHLISLLPLEPVIFHTQSQDQMFDNRRKGLQTAVIFSLILVGGSVAAHVHRVCRSKTPCQTQKATQQTCTALEVSKEVNRLFCACQSFSHVVVVAGRVKRAGSESEQGVGTTGWMIFTERLDAWTTDATAISNSRSQWLCDSILQVHWCKNFAKSCETQQKKISSCLQQLLMSSA